MKKLIFVTLCLVNGIMYAMDDRHVEALLQYGLEEPSREIAHAVARHMASSVQKQGVQKVRPAAIQTQATGQRKIQLPPALQRKNRTRAIGRNDGASASELFPKEYGFKEMEDALDALESASNEDAQMASGSERE